MRLLCDEHVPARFLEAVGEDSTLSGVRVRAVLQGGASDEQVARYAVREGLVVLTRDTDFYDMSLEVDVIVLEDPLPQTGPLTTALRRIAAAYDEETRIVEVAPGDWVG